MILYDLELEARWNTDSPEMKYYSQKTVACVNVTGTLYSFSWVRFSILLNINSNYFVWSEGLVGGIGWWCSWCWTCWGVGWNGPRWEDRCWTYGVSRGYGGRDGAGFVRVRAMSWSRIIGLYKTNMRGSRTQGAWGKLDFVKATRLPPCRVKPWRRGQQEAGCLLASGTGVTLPAEFSLGKWELIPEGHGFCAEAVRSTL